MPRVFKMPELAESVVEGEIVKWLVAEGEAVEEDQPIVEVMTDKVTVEIPSPFVGVLEKHLAAEGEVVAVDEPIAQFSEGEESGAAASSDAPADARADASADASPAAPASDSEAEDDGASLSLFKASADVDEGPVLQIRKPSGSGGAATATAPPPSPSPAPSAPATERATGPWGRVLAVPAARKLARELGIDIEAVAGSGPNGRIRKEDVEAHAERAKTASRAAPAAPKRAPAAYRAPEGYAELEERTPLRGLRRVISNQMVASHLQAVRTLHVDEADVGALVSLRDRLKPVAAERGVKLSYLPFIMKAVVAGLREFPMLNASLDEQANEIVTKRYYNLGLAVATEQGLVVPVVKDVDRRSILDVASEVNRLADAARSGKLTPEDVKGGTFSITNIGSLGGLFSFPIINLPEAAILGVHSIKKRAVVIEGDDGEDRIVARSMLYLSCSFDHRLVDGAEAALFTSRVISILENPESLMLDL